MRFSHRAVTHRLRSPFRVAHGTSDTRTTVFARLDTPHGPAWGEGALVPYYPYTLADLTAYLDRLGDAFGPDGGGPFDLAAALAAIPDGPAPARCALDLALHDAWGKALGQPLWQLWGLDSATAPPSSFTLSIPHDLDAYRADVDAAAHLPVLKLKVGTGDAARDLEIVRIARARTDAALGVDANSAWTVDETRRLLPELAALGGILYVEQPLAWRTPGGARTSAEAWHRLRDRLRADPSDGLPPLLADEAVQGLADVAALAGAADGVNVKLTKTGGLAGARALVDAAQAHGMRVLVGCMVETTVGTTAAAHLAPLADYADLDGAVLLDDPDVTGGMGWTDGRLALPNTPGLGTFAWR